MCFQGTGAMCLSNGRALGRHGPRAGFGVRARFGMPRAAFAAPLCISQPWLQDLRERKETTMM